MALTMLLHKLTLRTSDADSEYEFTAGLNVVTGSYGSGKSSMLELIKYGLGSKKAELMPTIRERLKLVLLEVTFGKTRVQIEREVGSNELLVTFADGRVETWSATPRKTALLSSNRIMELLGVPLVRIARKGAKGSSVAVSFFDMYRFVYLPQADVARSIAGHADSFLKPKRRAVLELAYELSDDEIEKLRIDLVELDKELGRAKLEADAVARFLDRAGAPRACLLTFWFDRRQG